MYYSRSRPLFLLHFSSLLEVEHSVKERGPDQDLPVYTCFWASLHSLLTQCTYYAPIYTYLHTYLHCTFPPTYLSTYLLPTHLSHYQYLYTCLFRIEIPSSCQPYFSLFLISCHDGMKVDLYQMAVARLQFKAYWCNSRKKTIIIIFTFKKIINSILLESLLGFAQFCSFLRDQVSFSANNVHSHHDNSGNHWEEWATKTSYIVFWLLLLTWQSYQPRTMQNSRINYIQRSFLESNNCKALGQDSHNPWSTQRIKLLKIIFG